MDSAEEPWYNHGTVTIPSPLTRWTRMLTAPSRDWSVFQQIFAEHWEAFQYAHPRCPSLLNNGDNCIQIKHKKCKFLGYAHNALWAD